jgi:hypothetical protein
MVSKEGGNGQGISPDVPKAPDTTQPDQAKLEKRRAYYREYYQTHHEQVLTRTSKWKEQNRERVNQHSRKHYHKNPQPVIERSTQWRKKNPERAREISREYHRRKRAAHPPPTGEEIKAKEEQKREKEQQRKERRREYLRNYKREYRRRKKEAEKGGETTIFPDPADATTRPESPAPDRPHSTKRSKNP